MKRRHLQVRLVKDEETPEVSPTHAVIPIDDVQDTVILIFVGVAALMTLSIIGKIAVYKVA